MSETPLTADAANALGATTDADSDLVYPAIGESPYYTTMFRCLDRLLRLAKVPGNRLRVYADGAMTFGVRAGAFLDGQTLRSFAGASAQPLTASQTNYVYLTAAGEVATNTSGFPDPAATPHLPLAVVTTGASDFGADDIVDCRDRACLRAASAMTAAQANTLVGAANADALHTHGLAGLEAAVRACMPAVTFAVSDEANDTRTVTVQAVDAGGGALAGRFRLRIWIAASDFATPDATGNTVSVSAGTLLRELTAAADYELLTDATGAAALDVTVSGAATRYVLADIGGRVVSSGAVAWQA